MSSENLPTAPEQPFQRMVSSATGLNAGAIAIEQERAIAEAQGQLTLAKRFPRSMTAAISDFLESCSSPEFAATAFYTVPNRGSGPSIRLAEEAARCYGNFVYGHRELSRSEGKSEIEVFAWDMEKNNRSSRQITVMHVQDTKNGPRRLIDQADIDNKIANVASKQMRGRILALMPKHMIAAGVEACKKTLAGGSGEKPIRDRIVAMAQAFSRYGVTKAHLEAHLGHSLDNTTVDELADMMGIFTAIKEGAKASDFFTVAQPQEAVESSPAATGIAAAVTQKIKDAKPKSVAAQAQTEQAAPAADLSEEKSKAAKPESSPVEEKQAPPAQKTSTQVDPSPAPEPAESKAPAASSSEEDDAF